jgi:flavin-binding protein dodecin
MADQKGSVVKIIELVGESPRGWEDAMRKVTKEAQKTLRGITRIGAEEFDLRMKDDKIEVFRVRAKVSFRIER